MKFSIFAPLMLGAIILFADGVPPPSASSNHQLGDDLVPTITPPMMDDHPLVARHLTFTCTTGIGSGGIIVVNNDASFTPDIDGDLSEWTDTYFIADMCNTGNCKTNPRLAKAYAHYDCNSNTLCIAVKSSLATVLHTAGGNLWFKDYGIGNFDLNDDTFAHTDLGYEGCLNYISEPLCRTSVQFHVNSESGSAISTGMERNGRSGDVTIGLDLTCSCSSDTDCTPVDECTESTCATQCTDPMPIVGCECYKDEQCDDTAGEFSVGICSKYDASGVIKDKTRWKCEYIDSGRVPANLPRVLLSPTFAPPPTPARMLGGLLGNLLRVLLFPTSAPPPTPARMLGGVPVNLPPIPLFPTSTPPPTSPGGQPVTLPPIPRLPPTGTAPPNGGPTPTHTAPITNAPGQLPPAINIPSGTVRPNTDPTAPPTLPEGITTQEFLTLLLTDDGSLQDPTTPQGRAFTQLSVTNPNLDPNIPADQAEIVQRYSLNTFYFSTGGENWAASAGWTTPQLPCGVPPWFGLVCGGNAGPVAEITIRQNLLVGTIPSEISGLTDLLILDLGSQGPSGLLFGALPTAIGLMTTLQSIILEDNFIGATPQADGGLGVVPNALPTELSALTNLVQLNMRRNSIFGEAPFDRFTGLSALNLLNLRENFLSGQIPSIIGDLPPTLTTLDLSANRWTGTLPTEVGRLVALTDLRVAISDRASEPDGFCSDVSVNPLGCIGGTIPSEIGLLVNLRSLWLFSNNFSGMLPTQMSSLASLQDLYVDNNVLTGVVPTLPGSLVNIDLATNFFGPALPSQLFQIATLRFLSLGFNSFVDEFPQTFNLPVIETLIFRENNLTMALPTTLGTLTTLQRLDVSFLLLTGTIPTEVGNMAALTGFDCQANVVITGMIPVELGFLQNLQLLNLNFNSLEGTLPVEIVFAQSLVLLDLGFNFLTGPIPVDYGLFPLLQVLDLRGNRLTGSIPTNLGKLTMLQELHLSINRLAGPIPTELGVMTQLVDLQLFNNTLNGAIPSEIGKLSGLIRIDVSLNELTSTIPVTLSQLSSLGILNLGQNEINGTAPDEVCALTSMPLQRFEADCAPPTPQVVCSCCTLCL